MNKRGRVLAFILIILILIVIAVAVYFTVFFYYKCPNNDAACYLSHQEKCARTKFTYDKEDTTMYYKIKGKTNDMCDIQVRILEVKVGSAEKINLKNKEMVCSLPIGSVRYPEEDLKKCHGILREEIQEIIIKNAHAYIVSNIGKVSEELGKVV